ncbi:MAG: hypothetical protein HRU69_14220 [Flammeovirgaceae bacterium]|nr:MAG: hypothetical protein HRU69_14220 [Flammeovirgaceae bacterium]
MGQTDCELKRSQDSIFVYACKLTDSKVKAIRASFTLPTTPSVLAAHILNVEAYTEWQYNIIKAEVLEVIGDLELIYRAEVKAPWPVSNRDLVVRLRITQDPATRVMTFSIVSIPDYIPPYDGIVRVPKSEGKWVITPLNNRLKIDYSFIVDPGGSVPSWLINFSIAEGPYRTFHNLSKRIKSHNLIKSVQVIKD